MKQRVKRVMEIVIAGAMFSFTNIVFAQTELPQVESVKKYLSNPNLTSQKIAVCKGSFLNFDDKNVDCWSAHTAKDLSVLPVDTQAFVLDIEKHKQVRSRCDALSFDARIKSRECEAIKQAAVFVSIRLPRMKLSPVKF
ncbi:MAG: hypothetical protein E6Q34_09870 [Burkholderiaceae bacterium]|nr:MAG: hypothetical protein E6Q34_09870 [Burkholderiaceae bacterium]